MMLLAISLVSSASPFSSDGLPNVPIYETVLPLFAIVCLSLVGMFVIAGLKK